MAYSLLYVSRTLLTFPGGEPEVDNIVTVSKRRNAQRGVTGALMSTGTYFAQVLEGEQEVVAGLMASIAEDPRHMRLKTIRTIEEERRFPGWSMAYTGNAGFVDRHIAPLFSPLPPGDVAHLAQRLLTMIEDFTRITPPAS